MTAKFGRTISHRSRSEDVGPDGLPTAPRTPVSPLPNEAVVVVPLGEGRALEVASGGSARTLLKVVDPRGACLDIEVRFDAAGPIVKLRAQQLELSAAERVKVACETFDVEASAGISLRSGGDLQQRASGNAQLEARNVNVSAVPGSIALRANDDVQLLGERVLLNCDRPEPLPEWVGHRVRAITRVQPPESEAGDPELVAFLSD